VTNDLQLLQTLKNNYLKRLISRGHSGKALVRQRDGAEIKQSPHFLLIKRISVIFYVKLKSTQKLFSNLDDEKNFVG